MQVVSKFAMQLAEYFCALLLELLKFVSTEFVFKNPASKKHILCIYLLCYLYTCESKGALAKCLL